MEERALVLLNGGLPCPSLEAGDVGTIVFVYDHGEACEVEFMTADGKTVAVEVPR